MSLLLPSTPESAWAGSCLCVSFCGIDMREMLRNTGPCSVVLEIQNAMGLFDEIVEIDMDDFYVFLCVESLRTYFLVAAMHINLSFLRAILLHTLSFQHSIFSKARPEYRHVPLLPRPKVNLHNFYVLPGADAAQFKALWWRYMFRFSSFLPAKSSAFLLRIRNHFRLLSMSSLCFKKSLSMTTCGALLVPKTGRKAFHGCRAVIETFS